MNKKVIAVIAAGVLAVGGVSTIALWAKQADDRAYSGAKLVSVVQVQTQVPKGATAAELGTSTKVVELPSSSVPKGAVSDLASVSGRVTTAQLEPGEVLLDSRMVDPSAKGGSIGGVPRGMQELSLSLDGQRLVGGRLEPGDTVGVLVSYQTGNKTKLLLNKVLITRTDFSKLAENAQGSATVTLALTTRQAERVANAAEFGKIWLTKQNEATDTREDATADVTDLDR